MNNDNNLFCINCGQQLPAGAKFCPKCGQRVETTITSDTKQTLQQSQEESQTTQREGERKEEKTSTKTASSKSTNIIVSILMAIVLSGFAAIIVREKATISNKAQEEEQTRIDSIRAAKAHEVDKILEEEARIESIRVAKEYERELNRILLEPTLNDLRPWTWKYFTP